MRKPITLIHVPCSEASGLYRATSRRFGVTAYGRTVSEAKHRLFVTRQVDNSNRLADVMRMLRNL
jgi:hypothetical protein